jgi:hypothetical protein
MGDCTSRPHFGKVNAHMQFTLSVNDPYFNHKFNIIAPHAHHNDEAELSDRLKFIEEKLKRLAVCQHRSKLIVEVRKGINIPSTLQTCFAEARTMSKVSTYPSKREFYTSYSDPYIPKWFNVFHISYDPVESPIEGFIIEVRDCQDQTEQIIGSGEVQLVEGSEVNSTWVKLKLAEDYEGDDARIEVRYNRVKDRHTYWLEKKQELVEFINKRAQVAT